jgi:outer membrane biosynthesis protein TonB
MRPEEDDMPVRMIVVLALAITAIACERLQPSQPSVANPANGQLSAVESSVGREFKRASAAVMRTLGLAPAAIGAANAGHATTEAATPRATRRARGKTRPALAAAASPEPVRPLEPIAAAPPVETTQDPAVPAIEPVLADESIYTAADVDVSRPNPHPSYIPWQWPHGVSRTETLEVVISQRGEVERIKLVSPPRRMVDVMALSAAKMWTFDPALKDGAPVRYRLVLTPGATAFQP